MIRLSRLPALAGLLLVLLATLPAAAQQLATFRKGTITVTTAAGPQKFTVELALDPRQREQGLMYRTAMPADAGMVFHYSEAQPVMMWMKNTFIPLDMLFVRADGTISNIRERAVPQSLETIPSEGPVQVVIELNGGTAARLGIKPGDRVSGDGIGD